MTEPEVEIADIIFDCGDPERVAAFWAALLEQRIIGRRGPYVWLERREGVPGIGFQRVEHAKAGKNRVHLDLAVADLPGTTLRIETLGGRRVDGYESGGFLVMADPEGNEFCVIPTAPFECDEAGRADYLDGLEL